jgi:GGDEF domain-containing protein
VHIQASFGVATYPEDASDCQGLLALADQAMFRVKRRGKNAVGANGKGQTTPANALNP